MMRGLLILLGVALIVAGITLSILRFHVDGLSALSILGLAILVPANRWHPAP
jgi:hypothetical protein